MLKNRLLFGTIMTVLFTAVVVFDGWVDGSLTASTTDNQQAQGTIFCLLVALLAFPANLELSKLAAAKNIKIFVPVTIPFSILFATGWYWCRLSGIAPDVYFIALLTGMFLVMLLYQYLKYGTSGTLANCGAGCFAILQLQAAVTTFVPLHQLFKSMPKTKLHITAIYLFHITIPLY